MASKVTLSLDGFGPLQRALKAAPDVVRNYASSAVATSAFAVAQRARSLVPVATGTLKREIESSRVVGGLTGRVGIASAAGSYWRFVEFGTIRMPARPFFRPAAEAESEAFIQRMRSIGSKLERDLSAGRFL